MRDGLELAGRYRLETLLGRGGMGEVWQGVDLRLCRPVAVKLLLLAVATDQAHLARFRREAEIAATLNHPGITTVFDIDEQRHADQSLLFLVMELMRGQDLAAVLAGHPGGLPIAQVTAWAVQILDALAVAHQQGVVHRDIKPANLFLVADGRVKICDFGIARLADASTITPAGGHVGTPLYMAPELIQGRGADPRTDLYAFGCVLYELLTGTTWVDTGTGVGPIFYQHLDQVPAPPASLRPDIPGDLNTLILELLAKRPDDRPPDATAVSERLRALNTDPDGTQNVRRPPTEVIHSAAPASETSADRTPSPHATRVAPQTSLGDDEPTAPARRSPPARDRIGRRAVLLGGLGAAVLAGIPVAVRLADNAAGKDRQVDGGDRPVVHLATLNVAGSPDSVVFSPDGRTLAAGEGSSKIQLWDVAGAKRTRTLTGGIDDAWSVVFSPDGKTLAAAGKSDTVQLWDVASGKKSGTFEHRTETGNSLDDDARTEFVWPLALSPDGRTLATVGKADLGLYTVRLWDVAGGKSTVTLTDPVRGAGAGWDVAFSQDGRTLAAGAESGVQLWDMAGRRKVATLDDADQPHSMLLSPDGKILVMVVQDSDFNRTVQLWDVAARTRVTTIESTDIADGGLDSVVLSPDGKTLATAGADRKVRLWDVATGKKAANPADHPGEVQLVAFSPDGKTLATGSKDAIAGLTVRLWKIA